MLNIYNTDIFSGYSIETSAFDAEGLALLAGVVNAWPARRVSLDIPELQGTFDDTIAAGNYSVHQATGVDKLHAQGIYGNGVTIAIVDTGVWYPHPAVSRIVDVGGDDVG